MRTEEGFYRVYSYGDRLEPGQKLKIEHSISGKDDGDELSKWTHMDAGELEALKETSIAQEKAIYEKLRGAVKEWEEQAAHTMLLADAIEYIKTEPVKHTSNEWVAGEYGCECSNMVYKMSYHIRGDTSYNRATKKDDVVAWLVSWDLRYNFPDHSRGGEPIAKQERKRFPSKEKLDNYIIGRIVAFSDYFTDISPPIPKGLAWKFSRFGKLLPGYTVEGEKPPALETAVPSKEQGAGETDYSKYIRPKQPKNSPRCTAEQKEATGQAGADKGAAPRGRGR